MARIAILVAKLAPLVAKLAPLAKQAWPILTAIGAILADAIGVGGGKATPAALGLLAAGAAARRPDPALQALAAPLRPGPEFTAADSSPIFEFFRDPTGPRHRVSAVFLGGEKWDLSRGPALYADDVAARASEEEVEYRDGDGRDVMAGVEWADGRDDEPDYLDDDLDEYEFDEDDDDDDPPTIGE